MRPYVVKEEVAVMLARELDRLDMDVQAVVDGDMFSGDKLEAVRALNELRAKVVAALAQLAAA